MTLVCLGRLISLSSEFNALRPLTYLRSCPILPGKLIGACSLHSSLVLSKLNYGYPAYLSASLSTLHCFDALPHTGLHLDSGAFRSIPTLSLYVETSIPSIQDCSGRYCLYYFVWSLQHPHSCCTFTITPPVDPVSFHHHPLSVRLFCMQGSSSVSCCQYF